jgi:hypothetical protein
MILKMLDRSEMFVDTREGEAIRRELTKSETGFITVRGITIKKSAILKLENGGVDPRASLDLFDQRPKLATGEVCRGEHSIARELMRIANQRKEFKLLQDPTWRAEQTKKLKATGQKFCDSKAGECACSVQPSTAVVYSKR